VDQEEVEAVVAAKQAVQVTLLLPFLVKETQVVHQVVVLPIKIPEAAAEVSHRLE
jgi:hypothetical protein